MSDTATQPVTEQQRIAAQLLARAARMLDDAAGGNIGDVLDPIRPDLAVMSDTIGMLSEYVANPTDGRREMAIDNALRLADELGHVYTIAADVAAELHRRLIAMDERVVTAVLLG